MFLDQTQILTKTHSEYSLINVFIKLFLWLIANQTSNLELCKVAWL